MRLWCISGANFYELMISRADKTYLAFNGAECEGDVWFPEFRESEWQVISTTEYLRDEKNKYSFKIVEYKKA